jgi:DNA-directed RNA polymerase subunit K/omega
MSQILKEEESQYAFVVAVAKRARQIADESEESGRSFRRSR